MITCCTVTDFFRGFVLIWLNLTFIVIRGYLAILSGFVWRSCPFARKMPPAAAGLVEDFK